MLKIKNLTAVFDDLQLLDDINLEINEGELHTIIGPERSGKSSLAHTIMGNPKIAIKDGSITYRKKSILEKKNILGEYKMTSVASNYKLKRG